MVGTVSSPKKDKATVLIAGEPAEYKNFGLFLKECKILFTLNNAETLAKVAELNPDLFILEALRPGLDSFELCKQLRINPKIAEIPVIMVTDLADEASRQRGLEAGVADFITKPFDMLQVQARVRTLTRLNQQCRLRAKDLQRERDHTQAILAAVGEAVIVTNMAGVIQDLNPAAVAATGYQPDEARGRPWRLLYATEDTGKLDEILAGVQAGKTWRGEVVSRRKDDTVYQVALTVAPLFEPEDVCQPVGFVTVQRDITRLKETEQAHDEFISNVSHELRTPLSVITLIGDNLDALYDRLDDAKRRAMIRDIQNHSQILKELIGGILELSQIDSKHISSARGPLNLTQMVREEADKLRPLLQEKSQTLQLEVADEVPVYGNGGQLQQVIRNLVNNAIKYTDEGGLIYCQCMTLTKNTPETMTPWPGYSDLPPGRWAAFQVRDNGIGISAEHLPRLFERFYRVKAQQKIRGTGLGLAITRELVKLHNGHIAVASTPGEGSIFALYLPPQEG